MVDLEFEAVLSAFVQSDVEGVVAEPVSSVVADTSGSVVRASDRDVNCVIPNDRFASVGVDNTIGVNFSFVCFLNKKKYNSQVKRVMNI